VRLAQSYAADGNFGKALQTLNALFKRLKANRSARPLDLAETLLERGEVEGARSQLDAAVENFREALPLLRDVPDVHAASAVARVAHFYLAVGARDVGGRLLDNAHTRLRSKVMPGDGEYVDTAAWTAMVLRVNGREREAKELLEPLVANLKAHVADPSGLPQTLREAMARAGSEYSLLLDEEDRKAWREQLTQWRKQGGLPSDVVSGPAGEEEDRENPKLLRKREPSYTPGARDARIKGTVVLTAEIWPDGRAHRIRVVRPLPLGLSWSAVRAVRAWRFQPGTSNGKVVKMAATIEVNFILYPPPKA
jgi:TonB family protein